MNQKLKSTALEKIKQKPMAWFPGERCCSQGAASDAQTGPKWKSP
jgi:hypothetical protein